MKWLALLTSLTLLVVTHELGHLGFAKLFKTRVRRFYVFFNPYFSIFKAKKFGGRWHFLFFSKDTPEEWDEKNLAPEDQDNTLWGLGWLPLGGYCDIAGMIDETKKEDDMASEPQPWEYRTKPAWQRLCIISGGVLVNFLTALLLYGFIFAHWGQDEVPLRSATLGYTYHQVMQDEGFRNGDIPWAIDGQEVYDFSAAVQSIVLDNPKTVTVRRGDSLVDLAMSGRLADNASAMRAKNLMAPRMPFVVKSPMTGSAAAAAGMQAGDSVVSVAGKAAVAYDEITAALADNAGQTVMIGFFRAGQPDSALVTIDDNGKIGVQLDNELSHLFQVNHIEYTLWQAIPAGIAHGWETLVSYVSSLKMLFSPNGYKSLGGFGTMAGIFPDHWDWYAFWNITALLALVLAFMNIIPIPGLDGGHLMFVLWEMVTGRTPSDKFLSIAQNIGMFLLLALMVLANGNDLIRWLQGIIP